MVFIEPGRKAGASLGCGTEGPSSAVACNTSSRGYGPSARQQRSWEVELAELDALVPARHVDLEAQLADLRLECDLSLRVAVDEEHEPRDSRLQRTAWSCPSIRADVAPAWRCAPSVPSPW